MVETGSCCLKGKILNFEVVLLPNSHDLVPQFNKGLLQFLIRARKLGSFNHGVERVQVLHSTSRLGFDHDPIRNRDHRIHILRPCTRELRTVSVTRRRRFVYSSSRFSSVSLPGKSKVLSFLMGPSKIFALSNLLIITLRVLFWLIFGRCLILQ